MTRRGIGYSNITIFITADGLFNSTVNVTCRGKSIGSEERTNGFKYKYWLITVVGKLFVIINNVY